MFNTERDYNNPLDPMFNLDHDGKIDMLEQYAQVDFLAGGRLNPGNAELAMDYLMNSHDLDIMFPASLADDYDDEDYDGDGYDD